MSTTFTLTVEHDSGRVERWTGTVQSLGYDSGEPFSRIEVTSADMRAVRNLVSSRVAPADGLTASVDAPYPPCSVSPVEQDTGEVLRGLAGDLAEFQKQCGDDGQGLRATGVADALDMVRSRIARYPRNRMTS